MTKKTAFTWRINDILVASVLAVACGLLYWIWSNLVYPLCASLLLLTPEYLPLVGGTWLLAGVLGGYLIRRPGAALYTEVLAAAVSGLIGTQYSWLVVLSGLIQGLGAELVFLLFFYRVWTLWTALLAGAVSGLFMGASEIILYYAASMQGAKALIYLTSSVISGLVLAGLLTWLLTGALVKTGVLDSLASGRVKRASL
ncbi:MAG: ECF transporter S component [Rothia sp. (in: high G+C Gram-positive bacteria)]|nr:ECF transporter S component [Rothia sp. (in: high G+C Gram-positive bacteria)]